MGEEVRNLLYRKDLLGGFVVMNGETKQPTSFLDPYAVRESNAMTLTFVIYVEFESMSKGEPLVVTPRCKINNKINARMSVHVNSIA